MKKFILVFTIVLTMAFSEGKAQEEAIRFIDKPWSEIVAMAKKENKLVFLDAYASWCGPCKWMAANIFTNDTVADFFNKTFICASIDMEKGEGIGLRRQYEVRAYPTLLFIDGDGNMIHKKVGADRKAMNYIAMGKTALDPEKCLSASMKKYASGNYPPGFIPSYLDLLAGAYMPVEPVLQKYLASLPEDQVHSRETWNILNRYVIDMNSSSFDFLMKNRGDFAKAFSKDSVYGKITSVISASLLKQARDLHSSDSSYNAAKEKVRASGYEEADKAIFNSDLSVYQYKGEKEKFLALAYEKTDKFYNNDYQMLNTIAWNVQEMTNDKKYLDKAAAWAKRSMSLKNAAFNNDTYAIIQLRLGNKDEAIKYEKNAIELARKNKESTKEYDETLKRMMQPEP